MEFVITLIIQRDTHLRETADSGCFGVGALYVPFPMSHRQRTE